MVDVQGEVTSRTAPDMTLWKIWKSSQSLQCSVTITFEGENIVLFLEISTTFQHSQKKYLQEA